MGASILTWEAVTPDYDIRSETHMGRVWIHNRVYRWSNRVCREIEIEVSRIQDREGGSLWVLDNDPEKAPLLPRYCRIFKFTPCEFIAHDGRIRTAFQRRKL